MAYNDKFCTWSEDQKLKYIFNVFINKQVKFKTPVSIAKNPKINVWLTLIEKEMKQTLAKLLASSVTDVKKLKFV